METLNTPATETPSLSTKEMAAAAINSPELSADEFRLGERTFKIIDLKYDAYVKFLTLFKPVLAGIASGMASQQGMPIPGIELPNEGQIFDHLVTFGLTDLPEMTRIICNQTDTSVTTEQVKEWAGDPFTLCAIVMKQIARNNMIARFASFFGQALPLMKMVMSRIKPTASTTKETRS